MLAVAIHTENRCRIPIVVGVCGHRNLETPEGVLRKQLSEVWDLLHRKFPNTPFLVLDSLAEGADRLVLKYMPDDVPYIAVLPFASEEFKKDFADERSRQEFDEYLHRADRVIVVGETAGDYSAAADYVMTHSDLLLALWDQDENSFDEKNAKAAPGGTFNSVYAVLSGAKTLFPDERCVVDVLHIPVKRKNGPEKKASFGTRFQVLSARVGEKPVRVSPEDWQPHDDLLEMECFNRLAAGYKVQDNAVSRFAEQPEVRCDVERFVFFDALSGAAQKRQKREFALFFAFALLLGLVLLLGGPVFKLEWLKSVQLRPYVIFICAMWLYFNGLLARLKHSDIYTQSRSIAEVLRVKIFWRLWGISDPVEENFPETSPCLSRVFRNWALADGEVVLPDPPQEKIVLEEWVASQARWVRHKARGARRKDVLCKRLQWGVLIAAVIIAVLVFVADLTGGSMFRAGRAVATFVLSCGVFFSAGLSYFRQKKSWGELAAAYKTFRRNFDYFRRVFDTLSREDRTVMIRKLGIRVLKENSAWRRLRRKIRS